MKTLAATLATLAFVAAPALAQSHMHGSGAKAAPTPHAMPAQGQMPMQGHMPMAGMDMADGEVRKIDKDSGKITLKHGPIKNLDMPPMTMVFHVQDRAMLDKVKVGEKVRFAAQDKGGAMTVTAIEAAK